MKKSILIPVALVTLGLTGVSVFAATSTPLSATSTQAQHQFGSEHRGGMGGRGMGPMEQLTDAEKTSLQSMTTEQKQAFFDKKRTEMEAKMTAHENVIDKLLAGQTLTADEETLRQTIIKERATRKAEMTAMKAKMDQLKAIRDKQKAGTTLTTDEQKVLDSMPQRGRGGPNGRNGGTTPTTSTTAQ